MKTIYKHIFLLTALLLCGTVHAQDSGILVLPEDADSTKMEKLVEKVKKLTEKKDTTAKKEKVKSGVNHVPYPIIGIDEDLGFQYGIHYSFFDYGDGSQYPNYRHAVEVDVSRFTKGQTNATILYKTDYLIPGIRLNVAAAIKDDPISHFYGFNGSVNPIDKSIDRKDGKAYYDVHRRLIRGALTLQGHITSNLEWTTGVDFLSYKYTDVPERYKYESGFSLYRDLIQNGTILPEEAGGGNTLEIYAGLAYDTRNAVSMPTKGMWSEIYFSGAPGFFGHKYARISAHHRHYIPIISDERLILAYHVGFQQKIAGQMPFYILQNIPTVQMRKSINEGLGGKSTLRIGRVHRLVGEGYAWANVEARIRVAKFEGLNQSFFIVTNPFFDVGMITQPYRLGAEKGSELYKEATRLHPSAGWGFKIVMNRNFISSIELAHPFNPDDGKWRLYIGSSFAF